MVKLLKGDVPPAEYLGLRDPWYDEMLDGQGKEIEPSDWTPRFGSVRSAASSLRQAAERRKLNYRVSVRGDSIYVVPLKGTEKVVKPITKKAPAKRAAAPTKKATKKATAPTKRAS